MTRVITMRTAGEISIIVWQTLRTVSFCAVNQFQPSIWHLTGGSASEELVRTCTTLRTKLTQLTNATNNHHTHKVRRGQTAKKRLRRILRSHHAIWTTVGRRLRHGCVSRGNICRNSFRRRANCPKLVVEHLATDTPATEISGSSRPVGVSRFCKKTAIPGNRSLENALGHHTDRCACIRVMARPNCQGSQSDGVHKPLSETLCGAMSTGMAKTR